MYAKLECDLPPSKIRHVTQAERKIRSRKEGTEIIHLFPCLHKQRVLSVVSCCIALLDALKSLGTELMVVIVIDGITRK